MVCADPARVARRPRRGFTLLEVVVALTIGGIAVALAASMLATVSDHAQLVADAARRHDERAAGERLLRLLIGQMTWSAAPEPPSLGTSHSLRFTTWCDVPGGWQERCVVDLRAGSPDGPTRGIEARLRDEGIISLLAGVEVHGFLYLGASELGGQWRSRWTDGMTLPPVVGIVVKGDTLLIRTGDRG